MKSIRRNVFETNSSSTHSMSICTREDYDNWKKGKVFFDSDNNKFITREQAMEKFPDLNLPKGRNSIEDVLRDYEIYTYENYNDSNLEEFSSNFTTPGGEKVVAFGKYGYNG